MALCSFLPSTVLPNLLMRALRQDSSKVSRMTPKLTIGLILPLALSLAWPASSFTNILAAGNIVVGDAITLSPPAETLTNDETSTTKALMNQQAITQTRAYILYLPVVGHNACATTFSYNESLRYNLEIIQAAEAWESCYQGQGCHRRRRRHRHRFGSPRFGGPYRYRPEFCRRRQQPG